MVVITISGLHGTGKSTYAKALSEEFGLRHVSAGALFRRIASERGVSVEELSHIAESDLEIDLLIDERTKREAAKDSVVLDGLLAGWMAKNHADLKIYLKAPKKVRMDRIAEREGIPYETSRKSTLLRERMSRRRFKKSYGVDINDTSIYDLIINTGLLSLKSNLEVIKIFVQEYISSRGGK